MALSKNRPGSLPHVLEARTLLQSLLEQVNGHSKMRWHLWWTEEGGSIGVFLPGMEAVRVFTITGRAKGGGQVIVGYGSMSYEEQFETTQDMKAFLKEKCLEPSFLQWACCSPFIDVRLREW
jgi:hypothetical protein